MHYKRLNENIIRILNYLKEILFDKKSFPYKTVTKEIEIKKYY